MKINTHGWKMIGLEKVASETKRLGSGYYSFNNLQLNYDRVTGEVWVVEHASSNSWVEYRNDDIVTVCYFSEPQTAQGIADIIAYTMNRVISYEEEMDIYRETAKAEMEAAELIEKYGEQPEERSASERTKKEEIEL